MANLLDHYEIRGEIARGGMGVVYRAFDTRFRREVAIKMLGDGKKPIEPRQRARFAREATALAKLKHRNIVSVHSVGLHEGRPYIVMDLVPGESLEDRVMRHGVLHPREAARVVQGLAQAVEHAHGHDILHRDIKPANVLMDRRDQPRLTDFGLAKDQGAERDGLSKTGMFLGTPGFWPPEQAAGELRRIGPHSDVYGLGATLYALLTGYPPYTGDTLAALLTAMDTPPRPPSQKQRGIDRRLDAICMRCLEHAPEERYASAAELAAELERYLHGGRVESLAGGAGLGSWLHGNERAAILAVLGALAVLAVLAGGLALVELDRSAPPELPRPSPPPRATPRGTPPPERTDELDPFFRAEALERAGRFAEALDALGEVEQPDSERVWELIASEANLRLSDGNPAELVSCLQGRAAQQARHTAPRKLVGQRQILARKALDKAERLLPAEAAPVSARDLRRIADYLHAARLLLPDLGYDPGVLAPFRRLLPEDLGQRPGPQPQLEAKLALRIAALAPDDPRLQRAMAYLSERYTPPARHVLRPVVEQAIALTRDRRERQRLERLLE